MSLSKTALINPGIILIVDWNIKHQTKQANQPFEPVHEISNNMVCVTSKASDQPAHMRSLIRAFASGLSVQ